MKNVFKFVLFVSLISIKAYGQNIYDYFKYIKENGEIIDLPYNLDPDKISDYNKYMIITNNIKSLSDLFLEDKNIYDIILHYLPENYDVNKYYYSIDIALRINGKEIYMTLFEYNELIKLQNYKNRKIEKIKYHIYFEEIFDKKYGSYRGDPTMKCFTIIFDNEGNFLNMYGWR